MNRISDFLTAAAEYAAHAQPARLPCDGRAPANLPQGARNPDAWREAPPNAWAWIDANVSTSPFAASLRDSLYRYGSLTPRQLETVQRSILREQERAPASAPTVSVAGTGFSKLLDGFRAAQNAGLRRPRLRVDMLKFSLAPENGRNAGYVYVKNVDGTYLGKLSPTGNWSQSYDCTVVEAAAVARVGLDPFGALVAHGHRTGNCGICNRRLSDPESVTRGIGPVCAAKYGWL